MTALSIRVARRHLAGRDGKSLAAVVASRYICAVGGSPKQQLKKRYELAKALLAKSHHPTRSWLLVVKSFPGWKSRMVDDPEGNSFKYVLRITAPNGKNTLAFPNSSQEHEDEFDAWMLREADVVEQLRKAVTDFEAPQDETAVPARRQRTRMVGIPIKDADFSEDRFTNSIDFGLRDEKNRIVGCWAWVYLGPADHYDLKKRGRWVCGVHPTRDGAWHGSASAERLVDSRAEAEAVVRKLMMVSFKRYSKMYPPRP